MIIGGSMTTGKTGWNGFLDICMQAQDTKALTRLFELFLTAEEKENIATRFLIVRELLKQDKPQRQIAQELHVSIAKITRGSNELKRMQPHLLKYLKDEVMKS
jgi:TrpR family trp operon transcriptional repressor